MQSERNGKTITNISFNKKEVVLTFNDDTKLKLSLNTYSNFYLYKGKELSLEEEKEIFFESELAKVKAYVLNLFSKKMYSEKEIKNKLIQKKCNYKVIEHIISYLKEHQFIDDEKYCEYLIEEYNLKKYGSKKIIDKLYLKGIDSSIINKISFVEEDEEEKADKLASSYLKNSRNKSFLALKKALHAYLINQGYESHIASKSAENVLNKLNKEDEREILLKSLEKYVIIHQVDLLDNSQKEKLIKKYLLKGFKYNLIKEVLEELWKN